MNRFEDFSNSEQNRQDGGNTHPEKGQDTSEMNAFSKEAAINKLEGADEKKQLELGIRSAQDVSGLYRVIQESKGIQGSQKFYSPEELVSLLDRVGRGENPSLLTNTLGLRQKATELLQIQKLKNELNEDPKMKLKKLLENINFNLQRYNFNLTTERDEGRRVELSKKIADLEKRKLDVEREIGSLN